MRPDPVSSDKTVFSAKFLLGVSAEFDMFKLYLPWKTVNVEAPNWTRPWAISVYLRDAVSGVRNAAYFTSIDKCVHALPRMIRDHG